ncbi:hypothetical protein HKX48_005912 [Thoreauomyces humboldtii]|nr:hypothetical protein HKX48_005912 [Thoreauomyces humboldtii]
MGKPIPVFPPSPRRRLQQRALSVFRRNASRYLRSDAAPISAGRTAISGASFLRHRPGHRAPVRLESGWDGGHHHHPHHDVGDESEMDEGDAGEEDSDSSYASSAPPIGSSEWEASEHLRTRLRLRMGMGFPESEDEDHQGDEEDGIDDDDEDLAEEDEVRIEGEAIAGTGIGPVLPHYGSGTNASSSISAPILSSSMTHRLPPDVMRLMSRYRHVDFPAEPEDESARLTNEHRSHRPRRAHSNDPDGSRHTDPRETLDELGSGDEDVTDSDYESYDSDATSSLDDLALSRGEVAARNAARDSGDSGPPDLVDDTDSSVYTDDEDVAAPDGKKPAVAKSVHEEHQARAEESRRKHAALEAKRLAELKIKEEREEERRRAEERAAAKEARKRFRQRQRQADARDVIQDNVVAGMFSFHQQRWGMAHLSFNVAVKTWEEDEPRRGQYPFSLGMLSYLSGYSLMTSGDDKRGPEILDIFRVLANKYASELPFALWAYLKALNAYDPQSAETDPLIDRALDVCDALPGDYHAMYPGEPSVMIPESVPATLKTLIQQEQLIAGNRPKADQLCQHETCAKSKIFFEPGAPVCARVTCNARSKCVLYFHKNCWRGIEKRLYGLSRDYLMGQDCPTIDCDGLITRFDIISGTGGIRQSYTKNIVYAAGQQTDGRGRVANSKKQRARSRSTSRRTRSRSRTERQGPQNLPESHEDASALKPHVPKSVYFGDDYSLEVLSTEEKTGTVRSILKQTSIAPGDKEGGSDSDDTSNSSDSEIDSMENDTSGLFDTPELLELRRMERKEKLDRREQRRIRREAREARTMRLSAFEINLDDAIVIVPKGDEDTETVASKSKKRKEKAPKKNPTMSLSEFQKLDTKPSAERVGPRRGRAQETDIINSSTHEEPLRSTDQPAAVVGKGKGKAIDPEPCVENTYDSSMFEASSGAGPSGIGPDEKLAPGVGDGFSRNLADSLAHLHKSTLNGNLTITKLAKTLQQDVSPPVSCGRGGSPAQFRSQHPLRIDKSAASGSPVGGSKELAKLSGRGSAGASPTLTRASRAAIGTSGQITPKGASTFLPQPAGQGTFPKAATKRSGPAHLHESTAAVPLSRPVPLSTAGPLNVAASSNDTLASGSSGIGSKVPVLVSPIIPSPPIRISQNPVPRTLPEPIQVKRSISSSATHKMAQQPVIIGRMKQNSVMSLETFGHNVLVFKEANQRLGPEHSATVPVTRDSHVRPAETHGDYMDDLPALDAASSFYHGMSQLSSRAPSPIPTANVRARKVHGSYMDDLPDLDGDFSGMSQLSMIESLAGRGNKVPVEVIGSYMDDLPALDESGYSQDFSQASSAPPKAEAPHSDFGFSQTIETAVIGGEVHYLHPESTIINDGLVIPSAHQQAFVLVPDETWIPPVPKWAIEGSHSNWVPPADEKPSFVSRVGPRGPGRSQPHPFRVGKARVSEDIVEPLANVPVPIHVPVALMHPDSGVAGVDDATIKEIQKDLARLKSRPHRELPLHTGIAIRDVKPQSTKARGNSGKGKRRSRD